MAFPTDRIDHIVEPNAAQRIKLDALAAASGKGADLIKASCPRELPATPPDRLAAEGKHLQAMLQAVQTIARRWPISTTRCRRAEGPVQYCGAAVVCGEIAWHCGAVGDWSRSGTALNAPGAPQ